MQARTPPSQLKVLRFISRFVRDNGYAPTMREIAEAMGWSSSNAAHDAVRGLIKRGFVNRTPIISRGLTLTDAGRDECVREGAPTA